MKDPLQANQVDQVRSRLSEAWQFLAGSARSFDYAQPMQEPLECKEFSYFMRLEVPAQQRTAGVGVLMDRDDALQVASHMFGQEPQALADADLRDACAEVCNVLSESISVHIKGEADMKIGLPFGIELSRYQQITENSTAIALYCSNTAHARLQVIVFYSLCS